MAASVKSTKSSSSSSSSVGKTQTVDFEVFGKVQGVFFRKHTQKTALELGLKGWVKNTERGTVVGTMQGPPEKITTMRTWLSTKGSPKSRIDRCEFKVPTKGDQAFRAFDIKR